MKTEIQSTDKQYRSFVTEIKQQIKQVQQRTVLAANSSLISLYWEIGCSILIRQKEEGWGAKVIRQLSQDLRIAFPDLKGFSSRNLNYMRKFAESWNEKDFVQQAVAQLPWGHICVLMDKVSDLNDRNWYVHKNIEFGWSRAVLIHQIESMLINREGNSTTNFQNILPNSGSELAQQTLKDPYVFDFLSIGSDALERDIENELTKHITSFLLELGEGFAFVGKQVNVQVAGDEFFIDLLFYHLKLRCYIVIELKTGAFKPEHIGQLSFYLTAVDNEIKSEQDAPTIGLLLCKTKNKVVAEYCLQSTKSPIGVSEYQLTQVAEKVGRSLPSIEEIEQEFEGDTDTKSES